MTVQVSPTPRPLKPRPVFLFISVLGFVGWVGVLLWIYVSVGPR